MASVFWEKVESQSSLTNDQRYTYNNSTWASQLNQIPPYAQITDVTVFLRYRSTVSGGKWEFGVGDTKFADGSTESSSKETTVSVLRKVTAEGANSGEINGDMIFRFHGAFRVYHLGHITVTWFYNNPVFVVSLSAGTGGTVSGAGTYEVGTNATITATPANGYKFVKWNDGNTNASRTVTVANGSQTAFSTPLSYTAIFEKIIVPPEITSAAITYGGTQVSKNNKVPTGEGFLIAVGIK